MSFRPRRPVAVRGARDFLIAASLAASLSVAAAAAFAADEVTEALDASQQAQRAARESQQRVNKLDDEAKALKEKRRNLQWRALQLSAYAAQLEEEAATEEKRKGELEAQLARIANTGTDLQPLMVRMVAELETFIAADLPFLQKARSERVAELRVLIDDPARTGADKFRRVLEAYRSEVEYGHSMGAEDAEVDCAGTQGAATLVRVGRIGLYCLAADGKGGYWDAQRKRYQALDEDGIEEVRKAVVVARGEAEPGLVTLPVPAPGRAK